MPKWLPDITSGVSPISVALVLVLHCSSYPCSDVVLTIPGSQIHETQDAWYWPETNGIFFGNLKRRPGRGWNLHFSHTFWTHPAVMVKCVGGNICNLKMFGWKFGIWKTMQFLLSIELMCHLLSQNYIWVYFCWTESWINQTHKKSFREKFANI